MSGTEIIDRHTFLVRQLRNCVHMSSCKIHDMNVIPHTGSVRRIIIVSEDTQLLQLADRNLRNVGHKVVRNALRVFSDHPRRMCADRVEVTKQDDVPFRIGGMYVRQDLLQHPLRPAIRVRADALRAVFRDRNEGGISVDRRAGAEDDVLAAMLPHALYQRQGSGNVVGVILDRLLYRFSYRLQSGEMNDRVNLLRGKDAIQAFLVKDIPFHKVQRLSGNLLHPVNRLLAGVVQVVDHRNLITCIQQFHARMAADKPGSSRNKNSHSLFLLIQDSSLPPKEAHTFQLCDKISRLPFRRSAGCSAHDSFPLRAAGPCAP